MIQQDNGLSTIISCNRADNLGIIVTVCVITQGRPPFSLQSFHSQLCPISTSPDPLYTVKTILDDIGAGLALSAGR